MTRCAGSVRAQDKNNTIVFQLVSGSDGANMFFFGPPPSSLSLLRNAGAMIYRTSEKYRYKDDVACSKMQHQWKGCRAPVKSGWGPCR